VSTLSNNFQGAWEQMNQLFSPSEFVSNLRLNFSTRDWPDRKDENFKYTNMSRLVGKNFHLPPKERFDISPDDTINRIVFVNGFLNSSQILDKNIAISDQEVKFSILQHNSHQFMSQLNQAGGAKTSFINISGQIPRPLIIQYFNVGCTEESLVQPRIEIKLEANSTVSIIEESISQTEGGSFINKLCSISIGENSQMHHYRLQCEGLHTIYNATNHVEVGKNAKYRTWNFNYGSLLAREVNQVRLIAEYASADIYGLYLPDGKRQHDHHVEVYHDAKNTTSNQHYKGILKDHSRAVFNGRIFVAKTATEAQAKQLNNNLLLSNNSEIDTKPELIIENPDVKCSHGATVGQLSQEQTFYLMSRGMTLAQAEDMLCHAFSNEIVASIVDNAIQERIIFAQNSFFNSGE
jgi:Fe-S cluster assembly protein SufD